MTAAPEAAPSRPAAAPGRAGSRHPARPRRPARPHDPLRRRHRARRARRAAPRCRRPAVALTDHDTLAGYRDVVAAGAVPAGLKPDPRRRDQRDRRRATSGCGRASCTSSASGWTRTTRLRGGAGRAARPPPRAVRADGRRLRELGLPIDDQSPTIARTDDDALGRPTIARALVAAGFADERRGRVPPAPRLGPPGLRAARRTGSARGDRGDPGGRRSAGAGPFRRGARTASSCSGSWSRGWAASRSTTARSTPRGRRDGRGRHDLGLVATGGSDYHGDTGTYAEAHAELWVPPEVADGAARRSA